MNPYRHERTAMSIKYEDGSVAVHHGDCLEVIRRLPETSIDAVVTYTAYELPNDGKSSTNWVFAEMVLPKDTDLKTLTGRENVLPLLVCKILELGRPGIVPCPPTSVPVGSMTLDNETADRNHNVVDGIEGAVYVSGNATGVDTEIETSVHVGDLALKLTDAAQLAEVFSKLGASFEAGMLGIGPWVSAASLPREQGGRVPVVGAGRSIGFRDSALADLVGAFSGASSGPVFGLHVGRRAEESFIADGALVFVALLLEARAEFVRANTPARGLPAVSEPRRVSIVDDTANWAFTFDPIFHAQSVTSVWFTSNAWDRADIDTIAARGCVNSPVHSAVGGPLGGYRSTTAEACVIEGFKCVAIERDATYPPLMRARLEKPIEVALFGETA
jgi:hypothetical protein